MVANIHLKSIYTSNDGNGFIHILRRTLNGKRTSSFKTTLKYSTIKKQRRKLFSQKMVTRVSQNMNNEVKDEQKADKHDRSNALERSEINYWGL